MSFTPAFFLIPHPRTYACTGLRKYRDWGGLHFGRATNSPCHYTEKDLKY